MTYAEAQAIHDERRKNPQLDHGYSSCVCCCDYCDDLLDEIDDDAY